MKDPGIIIIRFIITRLIFLLPEDVHELEESAVGDLVLDFIHELGEPVTCGDVHVRIVSAVLGAGSLS